MAKRPQLDAESAEKTGPNSNQAKDIAFTAAYIGLVLSKTFIAAAGELGKGVADIAEEATPGGFPLFAAGIRQLKHVGGGSFDLAEELLNQAARGCLNEEERKEHDRIEAIARGKQEPIAKVTAEYNTQKQTYAQKTKELRRDQEISDPQADLEQPEPTGGMAIR